MQKSDNLQKHVQQIYIKNSAVHEKVRRLEANFFSLLKFLLFWWQNVQPTVECVKDSKKESKLECFFSHKHQMAVIQETVTAN